MGKAKKPQTYPLSMHIPFIESERKDFDAAIEARNVIKGQLIRSLLVAWTDPRKAILLEKVAKGDGLISMEPDR